MTRYKHAPQKRDESLQPLSRDHYTGLVQAEHLRKAADAATDGEGRRQAVRDFSEAWRREIAEHFEDEEHLLGELMTETETAELLEQHRELRWMAAEARDQGEQAEPGSSFCSELGRMLRDHIRWEERELFPAVQERATPEQFEALAEHTAPIEDRRGRTVVDGDAGGK